MIWVSAVFIAAVSNLDNLAAGFAFGMRGRGITAAPNLVIAAVTMVATAGAITFGRALSHLMPHDVASALGALIIIAIGGATIASSLHTVCQPTSDRRSRRRPGGTSDAISSREALVLGVALSLNNVGSGVGAGVAGVSPLVTTALAGVFSLICVGGGSRTGSSVGRLVGGWPAPIIGGLVLVGVGTAILSGAQ
ncbi:MAG: manganese efflux pump [Solirubrobacterales bacterium]|nr:manganese efflux pump [Solirubrobacterales bacterium]